jgi:Tol biopolymer transport system component
MRDVVHALKSVRDKTASLGVVPVASRTNRGSLALWGVASAVLLALLLVAWQLREREVFWSNPLGGARVERLTDFPGDEVDASISPDGKFVVFVSDRDGQFDAWVGQIGTGEFVNLTRGRFETLDIGETGTIRRVGFSIDGSEVWVQEGTGAGPYAIWKGPTVGGSLQRFLPGGMEPAWSPDGKQIAYHTADPGDPIFLADVSGANPRRLFADAPGGHCHHLTWSPDGRYLYFVRGVPATSELDIWRLRMGLDGEPAQPERITTHNSRIGYIGWLDSRTMIYSATAEDGVGQWLYSMDVERRRPHRVSTGVVEQYLSVAVAGEDRRRVMVSLATPSVTLWSVPLGPAVSTEVTVSAIDTGTARATAPVAADQALLFLSSRGGPETLWRREDSASREFWRPSGGSIVAPPAVSPDGRRLAASVRSAGRTTLLVLNADGTAPQTIAEQMDVRGGASWSPDGRSLVVAVSEGGRARILRVPVEGEASATLVGTPSYHPVWSPDGSIVLYSEPLQAGTFMVRAVTPEGVRVPIPEIRVPYAMGAPYSFTRDGRGIVYLSEGFRRRNFFHVDLATGARRQLTEFPRGAVVQTFDLAADGDTIIFDRRRENSDIVLLDLAEM